MTDIVERLRAGVNGKDDLVLTAESCEAADEIERLREALLWCSSSKDFQEGGLARVGWLKLCAPLINAAMQEEKT